MVSVLGQRQSRNGLGVYLVEPAAGATQAVASPHHQLGVHLGRSVRARCRFGGRTHARLQSRGDIDLVPAGVDGVWEDDRPTRILRLTVSASLLHEAALGLDLDHVDLAPQYQVRDPQIEHIALALEAELAEPAGSDWIFGETLGLALALRLARQYRTSGRAPAGPLRGLSRTQLARVIDCIESQLDQPLSLATLAAVAGLSASHFKTLFKQSTGAPVHQFVLRRRVERARLLLEQGTPIAQVALATGFADQSHLARWMRRLVGVPPRALLEAHR